ncbi:MAG: spheroidene monooxygenase [Fulvivirga sp.]|nr:spheroidene monooxygenase [Fulvivirga sp.]
MRNAGELASVAGQSFYKLMGSGRGLGFNAWPDWSVYVLFQVWEKEDDALRFFDQHPFFETYRQKSEEYWTVHMQCVQAVGNWDGQNPLKTVQSNDSDGPFAVLTRATIKWGKMFKFWSYVTRAQRPLKGIDQLIFTKGVGEVPIRNMATFSLWESKEDMLSYAYGTKAHQGAISRTKKYDWYEEELFARFVPYKSLGTWKGEELLKIFEAS